MRKRFLSIPIGLAVLLLAACGPVTGSDLEVALDNKADAPRVAGIDVHYPDSYDSRVQLELQPGGLTAIAFPGWSQAPFRVQAWDQLLFNQLSMSLLVGVDPRGADAEHVEDAGRFWWSPSLSVSPPDDDHWYFFVVRNDGAEPAEVVVRSEPKRGVETYAVDATLSRGTSECEVRHYTSIATGGYRLGDLVPDTAHTISIDDVEGYVGGLRLFEAPANQEPFEHPLFLAGAFEHPTVDGLHVLVDEVEGRSLTFTPEAGMAYFVAVVVYEPWLAPLSRSLYTNAAVCEGAEPCPVTCP